MFALTWQINCNLCVVCQGSFLPWEAAEGEVGGGGGVPSLVTENVNAGLYRHDSADGEKAAKVGRGKRGGGKGEG